MYVGVGPSTGLCTGESSLNQDALRVHNGKHVPCRARVAGNPSTCGGDMDPLDPWIHHGRENMGAAWAVQ